MKRILAALTILVVLAAPAYSLTLREHHLVHWTNVYRASHDLSSLHERHRLHRVALHAVRRMISCGCLSHTVRPPCAYWGQNIGLGPTVRAIFRAFKRSTPHRHNLLDPGFHRIGVAARHAAGAWWVAMEFCG